MRGHVGAGPDLRGEHAYKVSANVKLKTIRARRGAGYTSALDRCSGIRVQTNLLSPGRSRSWSVEIRDRRWGGREIVEAYQASHRRAKAHQSYLTTSVRKARESIEVLDNSPLTAGTVKMVTVHPPEPAGPKQILLG